MSDIQAAGLNESEIYWWQPIDAESKADTRSAILVAAYKEIHLNGFQSASLNNILAHTGVTKGILRVHLGLIVPKNFEKCRIRVDDTITAWQPGEMFIIDDTYEHEVWNDTEEERVVILLDFDRPMGFAGRTLNKLMLWAMKRTAFYQDPKKNLEDAESRLEAAIQQNSKNMEAMSDPS